MFVDLAIYEKMKDRKMYDIIDNLYIYDIFR